MIFKTFANYYYSLRPNYFLSPNFFGALAENYMLFFTFRYVTNLLRIFLFIMFYFFIVKIYIKLKSKVDPLSIGKSI